MLTAAVAATGALVWIAIRRLMPRLGVTRRTVAHGSDHHRTD